MKKEVKNKIHRVSDSLYGVNIYFMIEPDATKAKELAKKVFDDEVFERLNFGIPSQVVGVHFRLQGEDDTGDDFICSNFLVWLTRMDYSVAAHEALHTTLQVLGERGMKSSQSADEAFCYYLSWLMNFVEECFTWYREQKKVKRKKK